MSFGFSLSGHPANVKKHLESAFDKAAENCKQMPHEAESIVIAKQLAMKHVDFYLTVKNVSGISVNCSGHASNYIERGDSTFLLDIKPLYGFVE